MKTAYIVQFFNGEEWVNNLKFKKKMEAKSYAKYMRERLNLKTTVKEEVVK